MLRGPQAILVNGQIQTEEEWRTAAENMIARPYFANAMLDAGALRLNARSAVYRLAVAVHAQKLNRAA